MAICIAEGDWKVDSSWLHLGVACRTVEVAALIDLHLFELLPRKQISRCDGRVGATRFLSAEPGSIVDFSKLVGATFLVGSECT
jgi:hypothetical protein